MILSKLLNKNFFFLFIPIFFICNYLNSNEPIDIWDIENSKKKNNSELENNSDIVNNDIG